MKSTRLRTMYGVICFSLLLILAVDDLLTTIPGAANATEATDTAWDKQVLYLAMTDRFCNGDLDNDQAGTSGRSLADHLVMFHGGDLAGLQRQLPYLHTLGISALWLTPVYRQTNPSLNADGAQNAGYHGYWPDFAFPDDSAIEPKFGNAAALKSLVETAKGTGIKVMMDMVVNHSGQGARIVNQRPEWFHSWPECKQLGSPDIYCPLYGLPDFRQENPETAQYLTEVSQRWIHQFSPDGIRLDTAKHVPLDYLHAWASAMKQERPGVFLIAEVWIGPLAAEAGTLRGYFDAGFDSAMNFPLREALVGSLAKGKNVGAVAATIEEEIKQLGAERLSNLVTFVDNHDVTRFTTEAGCGSAADDIVLKKYRMALTALFTLPGIPQIYYGDELGMCGGRDPDNRADMPDWAWTGEGRIKAAGQVDTTAKRFLRNPEETFEFIRSLVTLRRTRPSLGAGEYAELFRPHGDPDLGAPDVFVYLRFLGQEITIVAVNNSPQDILHFRIPVDGRSDLTEAVKGVLIDGTVLVSPVGLGSERRVLVRNGNIVLNLAGKTATILVNNKQG